MKNERIGVHESESKWGQSPLFLPEKENYAMIIRIL